MSACVTRRTDADLLPPCRASRVLSFVLAVACTGSVAACGGDAPARTPSGNRSSASADVVTAEQVAKEARGKLRCPPRIASGARAATAPVDDIQGVRPGLTVDEARALVLCSHPLLVTTLDSANRYTLDLRGARPISGVTATFAEARQPMDGRSYRNNVLYGSESRLQRLAAGTSAWNVGFVGVPGDERVSDVSREEAFSESEQPTIESLRDALVDKYGAPTDIRPDHLGVELRWIHDLRGRPIGEASPLARNCSIFAVRGGSISYSPDCGVTIAARIVPATSNEMLAASLVVTVVDQGTAFTRMQEMEQRLVQGDEERKAREAKDASRNARKPVL